MQTMWALYKLSAKLRCARFLRRQRYLGYKIVGSVLPVNSHKKKGLTVSDE